ncbi:MAG: extracellular solute-binding protein, partial [Cohnella sp.]|nr:extracellular solute-binding protein [Cohnella sp.]
MAKKMLYGTLAAAMVLSATACSSGNNDENNTASSSAPASSGAAESAPASEAPKDKVTYSYFLGVANAPDVNTNETTIGKILEDQTGVNFKIEHVVGDLKAKVGTMIASNDYPDVINPDAAIDMLVDAGAFIDLTDLIEKNPNIKRVYGPFLPQMKAADGKIYY